jgi:ubiquinol-cytochrome c reductase iron-sulfur subunit
VKRWLISALMLSLGRGRRGVPEPREPRIVPAGAPDRRAETLVVVLLLGGALCAAGFIAVYALDGIPNQTQFFGLALGLAFAFLAAACVVVARRLVVTEELVEEYPVIEHIEEQEAVAEIVEESGSRFTRKRLVTLAAGTAGGALGAALIVPAVSLGPILDTTAFYTTPWRRGRRLVDEGGAPLLAAEIEKKAFYTAFPEGANREDFGAPLVIVRLDPARLELPYGRDGWAPDGILAYSKICTHAGCAIALYRDPLFPPAEPKPALVCPCHYSTFNPATGGEVIFGPAGRPLPQLPLYVDPNGHLRAAGNFSGAVGPAWWGVSSEKPRP